MRLSGFTRIGAMIGFFGALAIMGISSFQFNSDEVSRKDVLLAELLFGVPIFTIVGAGLGAGWDFFEKRTSPEMRGPNPDEAEEVDEDVTKVTPNPPRRRRKPPGGRRQH
ncbi:MAG: hypothetical protein HOC77_00935 [Chloroflexi bacterium]|jgi:hypothetical protein|nr:hypothetical protein [Chloroflexota bacterium]MBT4074906.1 hypothetical protein [Chloroflexota bacterium]MBT4513641.1 hypothetical protein [Chloroflexota bacterium]MBT5319494.1 hypothetical protein [Chloroflexota bacterium]MBT6682703.1 hypothetical protein [Chloroflexota bacterium]